MRTYGCAPKWSYCIKNLLGFRLFWWDRVHTWACQGDITDWNRLAADFVFQGIQLIAVTKKHVVCLRLVAFWYIIYILFYSARCHQLLWFMSWMNGTKLKSNKTLIFSSTCSCKFAFLFISINTSGTLSTPWAVTSCWWHCSVWIIGYIILHKTSDSYYVRPVDGHDILTTTSSVWSSANWLLKYFGCHRLQILPTYRFQNRTLRRQEPIADLRSVHISVLIVGKMMLR